MSPSCSERWTVLFGMTCTPRCSRHVRKSACAPTPKSQNVVFDDSQIASSRIECGEGFQISGCWWVTGYSEVIHFDVKCTNRKLSHRPGGWRVLAEAVFVGGHADGGVHADFLEGGHLAGGGDAAGGGDEDEQVRGTARLAELGKIHARFVLFWPYHSPVWTEDARI